MCIVKCRIFRNVCLLNGPGPGGARPPPFPESNSVFSPCNNPELRSTVCASVSWCTFCRTRFWVTNQFGIVVGFQFGFELVSVRILLPPSSKYSYLTVRVVGGFLKFYIMLLFCLGRKLRTSIKTPIITVWIRGKHNNCCCHCCWERIMLKSHACLLCIFNLLRGRKDRHRKEKGRTDTEK